eukprot:CAMPEP_0198731008 /NCGR_PEP_ID=MMETSP1475-20131203/27554_1 /TAXON_ID= ORGANISM="Unidentified sp., Strain CCMP1999" /NCGR_SAMPLE_ID=MMETSP1475 /ASSEMBLY_ACC=CAM_ASM_001111 /LENGTH=238 /DNA_ID=CAMNT_0044493905 /DNA_START=53 /DNA_END=769 /DNA_ORIENTATION=-
MGRIVVDADGSDELKAPMEWFPDSAEEPSVTEDDRWTQVRPTGGHEALAGGSSSSAEEAGALEGPFVMYGLRVAQRTVLEAKLKLNTGTDLDRVGLAVWCGGTEWIWGGLVNIDGELCLATGGMLGGRRDLAVHGTWKADVSVHVRIYYLVDSCVIDFGHPSAMKGVDISSLYANLKDKQGITFQFARICRLAPPPRRSKAFVGLYMSDRVNSMMSASVQYFKLRPCKTYSNHAQSSE